MTLHALYSTGKQILLWTFLSSVAD